MHWPLVRLVLIVSALATAFVLALRATIAGGGLVPLLAAAFAGALAVLGLLVLVRAVILMERKRRA